MSLARRSCVGLVALLGGVAGCGAGDAPSSVHRTDGYLEAADGSRLYYLAVGAPSPDTIVVLHGGPAGDVGNLAPDMERLAADRVLIFYDQRGGGRSGPVPDSDAVTAEAHVADLEVVRRRFGLERLTLLGHSWGAGLAALYALEHPDRVERLLLVGSLPPSIDYMRAFRETVVEALGPADLARHGAIVDGWAEAEDVTARCREIWVILMPHYTQGPSRPRGDMCGAPPTALRQFFDVGAATMGSLGAWDWRADLARVPAPTLVIHGEHDPIPLESARAWAEALADARLLMVRDAAHFPHAEQPEIFADAVATFLTGDWPEDAETVSAIR